MAVWASHATFPPLPLTLHPRSWPHRLHPEAPLPSSSGLGLANERQCREVDGLKERGWGISSLLSPFFVSLCGHSSTSGGPSSKVPHLLGISVPISSSYLFKHKGGKDSPRLLIPRLSLSVPLTPLTLWKGSLQLSLFIWSTSFSCCYPDCYNL